MPGIWTCSCQLPNSFQNCLNQWKSEVVSESKSEEFIFWEEEEESDMDDDTTGDSIGLNYIQPTTSIHLSVVRCALSQPKEKDDWRRTIMFHIIMKIGGSSCKIIIDRESCINAVSSIVIAKLGLNAVLHPHPYRVTWINSPRFGKRSTAPRRKPDPSLKGPLCSTLRDLDMQV